MPLKKNLNKELQSGEIIN